MERFVKESKALKTTVYVVGAVALCFLPMVVKFFSYTNFAWGVFSKQSFEIQRKNKSDVFDRSTTLFVKVLKL